MEQRSRNPEEERPCNAKYGPGRPGCRSRAGEGGQGGSTRGRSGVPSRGFVSSRALTVGK